MWVVQGIIEFSTVFFFMFAVFSGMIKYGEIFRTLEHLDKLLVCQSFLKDQLVLFVYIDWQIDSVLNVITFLKQHIQSRA
jgi:hypothetical protein